MCACLPSRPSEANSYRTPGAHSWPSVTPVYRYVSTAQSGTGHRDRKRDGWRGKEGEGRREREKKKMERKSKGKGRI